MLPQLPLASGKTKPKKKQVETEVLGGSPNASPLPFCVRTSCPVCRSPRISRLFCHILRYSITPEINLFCLIVCFFVCCCSQDRYTTFSSWFLRQQANLAYVIHLQQRTRLRTARTRGKGAKLAGRRRNRQRRSKNKKKKTLLSRLFLSFFFLNFLMLIKWRSSEKIVSTLSYFRQLRRFWLFLFQKLVFYIARFGEIQNMKLKKSLAHFHILSN